MFYVALYMCRGRAVAQLVEALRYNLKGNWFDSQWVILIFY
jgi:hypothetical protein